jgi:probable HAF family extracellular repeat protein
MPHASAQSFQISAVNPLSGDQTSIAMGINNAGMLVGTSYDANGNGHAYYLQGGTQTALATLGGSTSEANGISSDGRIAGSSALSSGLTHACYWISGTPADADPANVYGPSCGLTINSAGVLAGYYTNSSSQPQGFTFNGLVLAAVNYPSATQTTVNGINDQGLLVGSYTSSGGVFGFIENGATFQTVPNLSGGTEGQANAVNLATDVAGWVTNSSDQEQAALWRNETLILLGDLGGNYGEAMGLNNYGQVVGASNIAASSYTPAYTANGNTSSFTAAGSLPPMNDSLSHAFLWQNGTLYDLNAFLPGNSGWILQSAMGINDSGQIVGYGTLNGVLTGFVLTPVASTPVNGAGTLALSQSAYSTTNGNGTVTITVTRTGGTTGVVSAQIATAPGTANAGADFTPVYQTVTFANGQGGSQTVTVPIVDDSQAAGSDNFTVRLFWITGGAAQGSTTLATVTVQSPPADTPTMPPWALAALACLLFLAAVSLLSEKRATE